MLKKTKRIRLVDVAKGLSILLVVLGHSHILENDINRSFSSFRMPFFFFLSGIFYNSKGTFRSIFFSRSDSLLKPYFITLFIVACLNLNLTDGLLGHRLFEIIYGVGDTIKTPWAPLWFLPHLWLLFMSCYFFIRFKFYQNNSVHWNLCVWLLLLATASFTTRTSLEQSYFNLGGYVTTYGLPLRAEILPISLTFFLLGYSLKEQVKLFTPSLFMFPLCLALFVTFHLYFDIFVDLNHAIYQNVITATSVALCGIYISLCIAYFINMINPAAKIIGFIGSRSLFILLFHGFFMTWFNFKIGNQYWFTPILSFVLSIATSLMLAMIVYSNDILSLFFRPLKNNYLYQTFFTWKNSINVRNTD